MQASECNTCKSEPKFYRSPTGSILATCGNGGCESRTKPPIAGIDLVDSIAVWNRANKK